MTGSSGTAGGTLVLLRWSLRSLGGLEERRELERATFEVFGRTIPFVTGLFWCMLSLCSALLQCNVKYVIVKLVRLECY